MLIWALVLLLAPSATTAQLSNVTAQLLLAPAELSLVLDEHANISITYRGVDAHGDLILTLSDNSPYVHGPRNVTLDHGSNETGFGIVAKAVVSHTVVEIVEALWCDVEGTNCTRIETGEAYTRVSVIKSRFVDVLIVVVGWAYFFAWSISFYPQIILNYQRKSVVGLNFDFLFLNIVGFAAYTIYNVMNYWDQAVQDEYARLHPKSPMPVLLNDVIFSVHALIACLVTALQAFMYERQNQRVHPGFIAYGGALVTAGVFALILSLFHKITYLQFVTSLSYLKMAVTCSKYFPQAVYNYQRKSTVGWSIGNVLLDFTGGLLDVLQMVLQGWNVDDWSAFVGNPVKFGLGMVSMVFDVVFLLQHYVFYRNAEMPDSRYAGVENPAVEQSDGDDSRLRADSHDIVVHD
ncbi:unnamed protein product, partial [Mesorhabditis spiculigera]